MPHKIPIARYLLHKACAWPYAICWIAGTLVLWTPLSIQFARMGIFSDPGGDWKTAALLALSYACTSGLGCFAGVFMLAWYVEPRCCRFNGAPHEAGERAVILSGSHAGREIVIYEVMHGQGGRPVPRADLGSEARERFDDLFQQYELLRLSPRPAA